MLEHNGQRLGTRLVSAHLTEAQRVDADGMTYELFLRHRRTYEPYTLQQQEFRHNKFTGNEIARRDRRAGCASSMPPEAWIAKWSSG